MVISCLPTAPALPVASLLRAPSPRRPVQRRGVLAGSAGAAGPALLVLALLLGATVLAPEAPQDLADICLRHNTPEACRVW